MANKSAASEKRRILAITNQKGGVGKTTTAINLGATLASAGRRVLILDLDPQGNASTGLGQDAANRGATTYDILLGDARMAQATVRTGVDNLSIIPSSVDLSSADVELVDDKGRARRLREVLARDGARDAYDHILIDCPPSLNLLTVNALAAADAVLVPLQCEFFALEGLSQLLRTIREVRQALNPELAIEGVVLTMFDGRNNLAKQVADDVRGNLGDVVFETLIPRNVRVSEAPSYGVPVTIYDPNCAGSLAYAALAKELVERGQNKAAA